MADEIYLHAEKIDKIYPGTKALDQVSFDIKRGKVNVLIGENGAGKSTLISVLTGLYGMTTGDAYFFGKSLLHEMKEIRKELGVCPQQNLLIDVLTVGMNKGSFDP